MNQTKRDRITHQIRTHNTGNALVAVVAAIADAVVVVAVVFAILLLSLLAEALVQNNRNRTQLENQKNETRKPI